jgi:tetratricopeptide (TPR) repeat protein
MGIPTTNLRVRWLALLAALSVSALMTWSAVRHGMAAHWARSTQLERWRHQVDFEHADVRQAIANYARAAAISPGSAEYWLGLAEAQETNLQVAEAEKSFRRAQQAYPLSADVSWRFGNFLLRQNRQDEAYTEIDKALSVQPGLTNLAISRCWQSTRDIDKILQFALPAEPETYWGAIDFLVDAREPDAAMTVWRRLMALHARFRLQKAFHLEDMLIDTGHAEDAATVWHQSLSASGVLSRSQKHGSLVWNGGFEHELLNGGLGWRFRAIPGAELSFDPRVMHSGGRSLRVEFDGTGNVDFQQLWQYLVLEPNTRYRLAAYFRTEGLTTTSPIRLELEETHFGDTVQALADLSGTQPWAPSETEFRTGPETTLVRLVLRRRPSPKLDNKIGGTIWMDDISLLPLVESSALR